MTSITCWRLEAVSDPGPNYLVGRFKTRQAAEDAKSAAGGYGPEIRQEDIVIFDSAIEFSPTKFDTKTRASGIAKLTKAERVALGLDS